MSSPLFTSLLQRMHCHLIICRVLVNQRRLNQCCNSLRCIWGHEHLFNDEGHHSRIARVLLQISGKDRSFIRRDCFSNQIESGRWCWTFLTFPHDWFWWFFILLFWLGLFSGGLLLIAALFFLVFGHQLSECYSNGVILLCKRVSQRVWVSLYLGHSRNHGQIVI